MSPLAKTTFQDWEDEQLQKPDFVEAVQSTELGYQITRLRLQRGLTQAQLAELAGIRQISITRLENGQSQPSLSLLQRVAYALQARVEINLVPLEVTKA